MKWSLLSGIGKGLGRYIGPDSLRSRIFVVDELSATTRRSIPGCCVLWDIGMPEIRDDAGRGRTVFEDREERSSSLTCGGAMDPSSSVEWMRV